MDKLKICRKCGNDKFYIACRKCGTDLHERGEVKLPIDPRLKEVMEGIERWKLADEMGTRRIPVCQAYDNVVKTLVDLFPELKKVKDE